MKGLQLVSRGRGHRDVVLHGEKIGFIHKTYDGWGGALYDKHGRYPAVIARNLKEMPRQIERAYHDCQHLSPHFTPEQRAEYRRIERSYGTERPLPKRLA